MIIKSKESKLDSYFIIYIASLIIISVILFSYINIILFDSNGESTNEKSSAIIVCLTVIQTIINTAVAVLIFSTFKKQNELITLEQNKTNAEFFPYISCNITHFSFASSTKGFSSLALPDFVTIHIDVKNNGKTPAINNQLHSLVIIDPEINGTPVKRYEKFSSQGSKYIQIDGSEKYIFNVDNIKASEYQKGTNIFYLTFFSTTYDVFDNKLKIQWNSEILICNGDYKEEFTKINIFNIESHPLIWIQKHQS